MGHYLHTMLAIKNDAFSDMKADFATDPTMQELFVHHEQPDFYDSSVTVNGDWTLLQNANIKWDRHEKLVDYLANIDDENYNFISKDEDNHIERLGCGDGEDPFDMEAYVVMTNNVVNKSTLSDQVQNTDGGGI